MVINDGSTFFKVHMIIEWAKLWAFVPFLLTCLPFFTCLHFFYVPYVLIFYVPYLSIFLRALGAFIFLRALCPDVLCSLRVHLFTCITRLHFFTCFMSWSFMFLTCPSFYVHYVPSFFRCLMSWSFMFLTCPSFYVHYVPFFTCFQFLTCLMCVPFLNNKWNNL